MICWLLGNIIWWVGLIKEIKISKEFKPKLGKITILSKRYEIWKDLYSANKKIAFNLLT